MNTQRSFFDSPILHAPSGELLKQEAISRVRDNADHGWREFALSAVRKIAEYKAEFTTDDVWVALLGQPSTHDPRAMGAVMTDAARAGICTKSNRVQPSERPECHRRPIAIWISRITK